MWHCGADTPGKGSFMCHWSAWTRLWPWCIEEHDWLQSCLMHEECVMMEVTLAVCGKRTPGAHEVLSAAIIIGPCMKVLIVLPGEPLVTVGAFMDLFELDFIMGFLMTNGNLSVSECLGALGAGEGARLFWVVGW